MRRKTSWSTWFEGGLLGSVVAALILFASLLAFAFVLLLFALEPGRAQILAALAQMVGTVVLSLLLLQVERNKTRAHFAGDGKTVFVERDEIV